MKHTLLRAAAAMALVAGLASSVQAQKSPIGTTWDCIISGGGQEGIAFLTFLDAGTNRTFSGYRLNTIKPSRQASGDLAGRIQESEGRLSTDIFGRNNLDSTNGASYSYNTGTNVYGADFVTGEWDYDVDGKLIGHFIEKLVSTEVVCTNQYRTVEPNLPLTNTTIVVSNLNHALFPSNDLQIITVTNLGDSNGVHAITLQTNWLGTIVATNENTSNTTVTIVNSGAPNPIDVITTNSIGESVTNLMVTYDSATFTNYTGKSFCTRVAESTNGLSFKGTVNPLKRLTLVISAPYGKITYSGLPLRTDLTDISGNWYTTRYQNDQELVEFFGVGKYQDPETDAIVPNIYNITNGVGAGYTFDGGAFISRRNKAGFSLRTSYAGGDPLLSATYGSFSTSRKANRANLKGIEETADGDVTPIKQKAVQKK